MRGRASVAEHETGSGVSMLFRSETLASIVAFFTDRGIEQVQVAELERELERQSHLSRGAVENALQVLAQAGLVGISLSGRNRVCEIQQHYVWAKLGELFEVARGSGSKASVGMPWLADLVKGQPRRAGFAIRPPREVPEVDLERTEAMLGKFPPIEAPSRRSPAPGRRR